MSALQSIRKGLSSSSSSIIVAILIFGLVATFGGFLTDPSAPANSPLSVNGKKISFGEFNLEFNRIASLFSESEVSEEVITDIAKNSIVSKELLYQKASDLRMNLSEEFINNAIAKDISFHTDGEFDTALFSGYMARLGLSVNDYRELVKSKYLANILSDFISKSEFSLESSALSYIRAMNQQRSLSFYKLDLDKIAGNEKIPDSDILNFYQQNQFRFIEPKKVSVRYVYLNNDVFKESLIVSKEEITQERNLLEESRQDSQTRVSHIQLSFSSEEEKIEKLNIADSILEQLSNSKAFEDLVLEYSDDFGSNNLGGDLGFTDGTVFPDEFEREIRNLKVDELSNVIEMSSSLHILKITEKNELLLTDSEIKDLILFEKSQLKLDTLLSTIEDSYISSNLNLVSSDLDLKIKETDLFNQSNIPERLFSFDLSEDLFSQTEISNEFFGPFEDGNGNFILYEVSEVKDETLLSLSESEPEIIEILQKEQAQITILDELKIFEQKAKENKISDFNSYNLIKRDSSLLPDNLLRDLFTVTLDNPVFVSSQDNGDIYIVRLTKIKNSTNLAKKEERAAAKSSLKSLNARSYIETFLKN
ncbi:MAG: peptidylprolyl isomerase [Gammaproteobacteria bacterium]|nr:MAG: peptidylprolyl isomerase [Gammaproteobacteria bacterium]